MPPRARNPRYTGTYTKHTLCTLRLHTNSDDFRRLTVHSKGKGQAKEKGDQPVERVDVVCDVAENLILYVRWWVVWGAGGEGRSLDKIAEARDFFGAAIA